jgi:hypothetical protein
MSFWDDPTAEEVAEFFGPITMPAAAVLDIAKERERQHARAIEGVCGACGGTTYNGRCTNACGTY